MTNKQLKKKAHQEHKQSKRIITLDILRGLFLTIIAVDHFRQFPSMFDTITGRGMLWVSAAEGFFIISGLVVGLIYGPKMLQNTSKTIKRVWRRALLLYGLSVGFTLLFTAWGKLMISHEGLKEGISTGTSNFEILLSALKLEYIYGWVDFLALYAVFMFIAPFAIYLTVKGKWWVVIGGSVVAWFALKGFDMRFGWQIFFMPAIVVGYHVHTLEHKLESLSLKSKNMLYMLSGLVVLTMLAISAYFVFLVPFIVNRPTLLASLPNVAESAITWSSSWYRAVLEPQVYKWTLPLGRVLFAWVWFMTLYMIVRHFEQPITKYTKNAFAVLGRNSLFTYCTMGIMIFGLHFILIPRVTAFSLDKLLLNTVINGLFLAALYGIVVYKDNHRA